MNKSYPEAAKRNRLVTFTIVLFMFIFVSELGAYRLDPIHDANRAQYLQKLKRIDGLNPAALAAGLGLSTDEGLLKIRERKDAQGYTSIWFHQTYKEVSMWGHELIFRIDTAGQICGIYGTLVLDIPADLNMRRAIIAQTAAQTLKKVKAEYIEKLRNENSADFVAANDKAFGTYIFANDSTGRAEYANFVSFFINRADGVAAAEQPLIAVNPQTGEIIRWQNLFRDYTGSRFEGKLKTEDSPQRANSGVPTAMDTNSMETIALNRRGMAVTANCDGFGPGGNVKTGKYYYGTDPALPNRLPFKVSFSDETQTSTMETDTVKTVDLNNVTTFNNLTAYSFAGHTNTEPEINGAYGQLNDAQFFGQVVAATYLDCCGIAPLSQKIVLMPHYGQNSANAGWQPNIGAFFGDGNDSYYPLAVLDAVGHEVSHGFSEENGLGALRGSTVIGEALCESFSDMGGEACEFFMKGSNDFLVGAEVRKTGGAIRYMQNPPLDGESIDSALDYESVMDDYLPGTYEGAQYRIAGVFNKAFYTLANTAGWTTRDAFKVFIKANQDYWTNSIDTFQQAAEGVRDAAIDLGYSCAAVVNAFATVDIVITCGASQNTLTLTSPNGDQSWKVCSTYNITWNSTGTIANIKIDYSTDNGSSWKNIVVSTPNDGSHPWTIPNDTSAACRVRVSDAADNNTSDSSDANFTIIGLPDLIVTDVQFEKVEDGIWNAYVMVNNSCGAATPVGKVIRADIQILGNKIVEGYNAIQSLGAGQSATIVIGLEDCYPLGTTFTGIAVVDKLNAIEEADETNNMMQKVFVNGDLPGAPVLTSPANNASSCTTTPTFKWNAVSATPAVDGYQVQVNTSAGSQLYVSGNLTALSLVMPANILHSGTSYAWYVRAHNALGWGNWSGRTIIVDIIGVPAKPTLSTPADNETVCTKTPTFTWGAVGACPAVDYYQVQINNSTGTKLYASGNLTATSFVVPGSIMNSNTTYAWYVRAHNASGWGNWNGRTIHIGNVSVPATPVLISPGNNVTVYTLTPTLKWQAVVSCPTVNYYQVQINYADGSMAYVSGNITKTSFVVPADVLYGGTTYAWYVRAHNASGWGGWVGRIIKIYQNE